jgi:hypothetical protein
MHYSVESDRRPRSYLGILIYIRERNNKGCGSGSAWSRIIFGSCIRIRIRVKSWIRIRVRVKSRNSEALEAQNRAVDAHNGGLEGSSGALEGLQTSGRRFLSLNGEQDPDPHSYLRENLYSDPH